VVESLDATPGPRAERATGALMDSSATARWISVGHFSN
jgi:hypothetical protein